MYRGKNVFPLGNRYRQLTVYALVFKPPNLLYMKRAFKILGLILLLLVVAVGGLVAYVSLALPNIEAPKLAVKSTPEKIERGRYLANHVMG